MKTFIFATLVLVELSACSNIPQHQTLSSEESDLNRLPSSTAVDGETAKILSGLAQVARKVRYVLSSESIKNKCGSYEENIVGDSKRFSDELGDKLPTVTKEELVRANPNSPTGGHLGLLAQSETQEISLHRLVSKAIRIEHRIDNPKAYIVDPFAVQILNGYFASIKNTKAYTLNVQKLHAKYVYEWQSYCYLQGAANCSQTKLRRRKTGSKE